MEHEATPSPSVSDVQHELVCWVKDNGGNLSKELFMSKYVAGEFGLGSDRSMPFIVANKRYSVKTCMCI